VPMYFVKRDDFYHDVAGARFRDLLAGQLTKLPGERAMMSDWANHLSTIFPEVRLKTYLEMRGADVGPRTHITALPAFFAGLYYDRVALDEAYALIREWSVAEMATLRDATPREGLTARIGGRSARDIAVAALATRRGRTRPFFSRRSRESSPKGARSRSGGSTPSMGRGAGRWTARSGIA